MLDFSRVTDFLADLTGSVVQDRLTEPSGLTDLLQNAGFDSGALANLSEGEITAHLTEHGIDPAQILPAELHELLAGLGLGKDGSSSPGTG
jgi:hypothetical protein